MRKLILGASLFFASLIPALAATPVLTALTTQACYPGTAKPMLVIASGTSGTSYISGAIGDPTNPSVAAGIYFSATNNPTSFTITSDNETVVPKTNVVMTMTTVGQYVCKITPIAVGYAKITIKALVGTSGSGTHTIYYAASAASKNAANTIFPTGIADASAAAAIDSSYMFVANDENNILRLYNRKHSGQSLYSVDITTGAGITDGLEIDLEGATNSSVGYNSGKRIYWIGSLGNSKSGAERPDRDRVIATDFSGTGASTTLTVKGYSDKMRTALITWGDNNTWNFTASASVANAMVPKLIDGFNIEGLTVSNEGELAYIGFRAPCVPLKGEEPTASNRKYAVVAPVTNFESMMDVSGKTTITPAMGEPILFDFGGLGIRAMERVGGNKYIIEAGLFQGGGTPAVYLWDGAIPTNPGANPITTASSSLIKLPFDLSDLVQPSADGGVEGHPEALLCDQVGDNILAHIICDNGTVVYYNDAIAAKDLAADTKKYPYAKFRVDTYVYSLTGAPALMLTAGSASQTINLGSPISNVILTWGGAAENVSFSGLPSGVTPIVNTTGKYISLSGTPTTAGVYNYTITTTQASGQPATVSGTFTVNGTTGIMILNKEASFTLHCTNKELQVQGLEATKLSVCDITGKKLSTVEKSQSMDVSSLPKGLYLLIVEAVDGTFNAKKFVKP